jgi:hypothetical protein
MIFNARAGRVFILWAQHTKEATMLRLTHAMIVVSGLVDRLGACCRHDGSRNQDVSFGKTAYLETTAASASGQSGQGVIYWSADGTALYKTPSGGMMHGNWEIKDNTLCANWKEKPGTGCVRYDKAGDAVTVIDAASGNTRAKIVKTAPGNAEKLAP